MYKVKHTETGEVRTVYALCGTMFLFYNGIDWYCDDIANYEPVEVE